jgi:hypothetical protein
MEGVIYKRSIFQRNIYRKWFTIHFSVDLAKEITEITERLTERLSFLGES